MNPRSPIELKEEWVDTETDYPRVQSASQIEPTPEMCAAFARGLAAAVAVVEREARLAETITIQRTLFGVSSKIDRLGAPLVLVKPEHEAQTVLSRYPLGAFTLPIQSAFANSLRKTMSSTFHFSILVLEEYEQSIVESDGQFGGIKATFLHSVIEDIKKRFGRRLVDAE